MYVCNTVSQNKKDVFGYGLMNFPGGSDGKSICLQCGRPGFDPWVGKIPLEKEMATHSSTLAWKIPWTDGGAQQATVYGVAKSWT